MRNNMEETIKKYEGYLKISEDHKAKGITYKDRDIDNVIEDYKWLIKMFKDEEINKALDKIWRRKI